MSKKVLILTYYWPPASGPGVQRWLKFVRYLPQFGWDPIIVTPAKGSYPFEDHSLMDEIPEIVREIRTKTIEPFRLYNLLTGKKGKSIPVAMGDIRETTSPIKKLSAYIRANWFIPDARKGWVPFATKAARSVLHNEEIGAVITTGPPHSTHLAGARLREDFNIPWIADFRDPWTTIYYNKYLPRTKRTEQKDRHLETMVLQKADAVTTVSPGLKAELSDRAHRVEVIYNGFDPDDIADKPSEPTQHFTLAYVGNFKDNQNVPTLWEAIRILNESEPGFKELFRLQLTGSVGRSVRSAIAEAGLDGQTGYSDFVPHHVATRLMGEASLLLFIIPQSEQNNLILTGKIFEYLASKTPMLSIGPANGNAAGILKQCDRADMIGYDDAETMRNTLAEHFRQWKEHGKVNQVVQSDVHMAFSRQAQTKQLVELLNDLKA